MPTSQTAYEFKNHEYSYNYFQDPQNDLKHNPLYWRPDLPENTCVPAWIVLQLHKSSTCCPGRSGGTAPSPHRGHLPTAPWQLHFVPLVPALHASLRPWECTPELPKVPNALALPSELWRHS